MIDVRAAIRQTGHDRPTGSKPLRRLPAAVVFPVLALLAGLLAGAAHGGGLYTAQVPVASQSDADRAEGLKAALIQVVARVSGEAGAAGRPEVAKAIGQAERYVQQFQYQQEAVTDNGQAEVRLTLVAQFDRDAIDRLLGAGAAAAKEASAEAPAAVPETVPGTFHVWVAGVRTPNDYARLMGALAGNDFVRDAQVELARGDGVQLRLATSVPLARALDGWSVVRVTNANPPVDGIDALLDLKP